ncbi:unnamed protein product [Laminaria digitata]
MKTRVVLVLGMELCMWSAFAARHPFIKIGPASDQPVQPEEESEHQKRACSLHELLPQPCRSKSPEWSNDYVIEPLYNCTCAAMKARYFCPGQTNPEYLKWEPWAVSQGLCRSVTRSDLEGEPLPPNFKVLAYGNSHLRQVVEALVCMFQAELSSKRVNAGFPDKVEFVASDMQCRSCSLYNDPVTVTDLQRSLLEHKCMAETDTCRCGDSRGEYYFRNGAAVHYTFSHTQENKGLEHALHGHGMDEGATYNAVFMNAGNDPPLDAAKAIDLALEVQASGSQFFWMSTYNGVGSISQWTRDERVRLFETGALYIDVQCMMRGMEAYTAGVVEGGADGHYCLPGPPNEIAVLLLKIMWVMDGENE